MTFVSTDPFSHQSENTWFTPEKIIPPIKFDLDPCTVSFRPFDIAEKNIEYDTGDCGLKETWSGNVWMNPPYGQEIEPFINKFINHKKGVAIVFARTGTPWMQNILRSKFCVFFLRKRVSFISKDFIKKSNAGADSCFIIFGEENVKAVDTMGLEGVFINKKLSH